MLTVQSTEHITTPTTNELGDIAMNYDQVKASFYFKLFGNRAGSFETALWNAFKSADENNRRRLAMAFPIHMQVFKAWYNSPSEREFFQDLIELEEH